MDASESGQHGGFIAYFSLFGNIFLQKIRIRAIYAQPIVLNIYEKRLIKVMSATFTIFYWRKR
jgi:hypothetical protein